MPDIHHDLPIDAPIERVWEAITSAEGLDAWWTLESSGDPAEGAEYELFFGPEADWRARVTHAAPNAAFELELTTADADWTGTRVRFELERQGRATRLHFRHTGWARANEHYATSCYCWAMYLRLLRRFLEHGERVGYDDRLNV